MIGAGTLAPHLVRRAVASMPKPVLAGLLALFAVPGYSSPIDIGIIPDPADTTHYVAFASQGGLGMPGRDYYLRTGADYDRYRAAYRTYLVTLQRLAGLPDAEARADRVIALEHRIAEAHWAPERSRDIQLTYNPMNRAQLAELIHLHPLVIGHQQEGRAVELLRQIRND